MGMLAEIWDGVWRTVVFAAAITSFFGLLAGAVALVKWLGFGLILAIYLVCLIIAEKGPDK